jgi:hypothetical protein
MLGDSGKRCSEDIFTDSFSELYGQKMCFVLALSVYYICKILKAATGLEPIGYRGALLSSLLQVNVYVTHNLLNVLVQIAKRMEL